MTKKLSVLISEWEKLVYDFKQSADTPGDFGNEIRCYNNGIMYCVESAKKLLSTSKKKEDGCEEPCCDYKSIVDALCVVNTPVIKDGVGKSIFKRSCKLITQHAIGIKNEFIKRNN